jgi:glycosyltransferase involved in cell wall biosynthesis
MNISFISTARYPTEKAYGVTIEESCAAANRMGHTSNIVTIGTDGIDNSGNQIRGINNKALRVLTSIIGRGNSNLTTRLAFSCLSIFFALRIRKELHLDKKMILWARDIPFVFILGLMKSSGVIVLEIHHVPTGLNARFLKFISKSENVLITTLTRSHQIVLQELLKVDRIIICPMAVPTSFFIDSSEKKSLGELVIGYIGKAMSSGQDNGLKTLLDVAKRLQELKCPARIQLVGIESDAIKEFESLRDVLHVDGAYFEVLGHISHDDVKGVLSNFDVGLLPYPNTPYNDGRFPIKVLEYAAAGCIIFASDTPVHRRIMGENLAKYYECGSVDSLVALIIDYIEKTDEFKLQRDSAYEWAKQFTYRHRVKAVLSEVRYRELNPLL